MTHYKMHNLTSIQNQLLSDIFSEDSSSTFQAKGLAIYRTNLRATAFRALSITFPTVLELIGEELLSLATEKLLKYQPPNTGDWAQWGAGLVDVLGKLPELEEFPFVPECAQVDFICHQLVRHKEQYFEPDTLQLMQQHDPQELYLTLNPTLKLITSHYPLADIRNAHRLPSEQRKDAFKTTVKKAIGSQRFYFACYLNGENVRLSSLSATEYKWLVTLQHHSLDDALEHITDTDFSFQDWLVNAVHQNLIKRVSL